MFATRDEKTQEHLFKGSTALAILVPILAVILPHAFFGNHTDGLWYASAFCSLASILNYFAYTKHRNLELAASIVLGIGTSAYSIGIVCSGGMRSDILVLGTTVLLICGLLKGGRGVIIPTVVLISLFSALTALEKFNILVLVPPPTTNTQALITYITCLAADCTLTCLFVSMREKTQARLIAINKSARQTAQRFEAIFQVSPNPILILADSLVLDCNAAAAELLGAPSKEKLLSQNLINFSESPQVDGRNASEASQAMNRLASENGRHRFEWNYRKFDGTIVPVEVTLAPIKWNGNSATLALWNDLTQKKRQEAQALQQSKLACLGEMSAGVAHEINNPLAIISASVDAIPKFLGSPEKLNEKLGSIKRSITRISKIVNGLKKFSRSGESALRTIHPLAEIVNEAIVMTEAKMRRENVDLNVKFQTDGPIFCNDIEIEQVIVNLLSNAVDAIENLEDKWIQIDLFEEGKSVVLQITDSGHGIPKSVHEKLFQPFFTTKEVGKGTGLGLSISKGILEENGGNISILTHFENTCFELRFSRALEHLNAA